MDLDCRLGLLDKICMGEHYQESAQLLTAAIPGFLHYVAHPLLISSRIFTIWDHKQCLIFSVYLSMCCFIDIKGRVKLPLWLTNYALHHEGVWGSGCIDPHFLDLSNSWRWVVRFTPWLLYPCGKAPWYLLDKRLGGPHSQSGQRGVEKFLTLPGLELQTFSCPAHSQLLYRLRCCGCMGNEGIPILMDCWM
jgi:hypothetical protein